MTRFTWLPMDDVLVTVDTNGIRAFHADEIADRERRSFEYWLELGDEEKRNLMKTVVTELQRLIDNVESWLPAGMSPDGREKPLDIVIRIWPDHTAPRTELSERELQKAEDVIESLRGILDD